MDKSSAQVFDSTNRLKLLDSPGATVHKSRMKAAFPLLVVCTLMSLSMPAAQPGLIDSRFIYESAPFPQCHASTIVEGKDGLVAAWFGGTREKHPDVGIWLSRFEQKRWTEQKEVANGVHYESNRFPCWNPVLFQPSSGPLMLFYKVGPSPS